MSFFVYDNTLCNGFFCSLFLFHVVTEVLFEFFIFFEHFFFSAFYLTVCYISFMSFFLDHNTWSSFFLSSIFFFHVITKVLLEFFIFFEHLPFTCFHFILVPNVSLSSAYVFSKWIYFQPLVIQMLQHSFVSSSLKFLLL
uniref:Uncharacterized protein n=1 Tax=Cacopsylla melanoneura TaxID=428564 RepID=A0A8D8TNZ5_9HEMI